MKTYSMKTGAIKEAHTTSDRSHGGMMQDQFEWLQKLGPAVDRHWDELTAFEQKFAEDILERFRRYGRKTIISGLQWQVIGGISEKVL